MAAVLSVLLTSCLSSGERFECDELSEIREVPFTGESSNDAAFARLLAVASRSPLMISDCISDDRPMLDPRKAPPYQGFAIGDMAVLIISDATGIEINELLPPEAKARWEADGMYAYFAYVSSKANRATLQSAWKVRLAQEAR